MCPRSVFGGAIRYTRKMKVIFAQGNPGNDYVRTRHNVGWRFLEAYAESKDATFSAKPKFSAELAEFTVNGEKILLVKPTTFYNDTGLSARALADFYKLEPENFLVIHDELVLPLGSMRTRQGGSDAGNNGIKSLNAHLSENTHRLRIGIFDAEIPRSALSSVLGKFTKREEKVLDQQREQVFAVFDEFIRGQFRKTTYKLPN